MDLILTGAHLIDPHSAKSGSYDIGFTGNRVSHVEKQLNADNAQTAIDINGKYVVPRLIDFHTGHGKGSFGFETARKMLENGFEPDVISSDVHSLSIDGPAYDLLHVMSKFIALGMDLERVVEKATAAPARAIDQTDIGHLKVGARADATIFHLEKGRFEYFDTVGERIVSDSRLVCDGLVIDGKFWGLDEE